ncbi:MAG: epoxyqueuosine reductase [Clostridia bacterium]|nr:epoxyqueuosine reductase [Clostridia bacterium]
MSEKTTETLISEKLKELFGPLPFGVSSFSLIRDRLIDCRAKSRIPENAARVISVAFPYYLGKEYYVNSNISMYAVPADYHRIAGDIIKNAAALLRERFPDYQFEPFIDNSPVPEVFAASCAGLGVIGKNGLLINETYGSFCFLGEIITDFPLTPGRDAPTSCFDCGECARQCPSGVLRGECFEKDKCLSDISQKKSELDENEKEMLVDSGCAWGCDVCQKVCPMNEHAAVSPIREFYDTARPVFRAGDSVEDRAFAWRGDKVINRNIGLLNSQNSEK